MQDDAMRAIAHELYRELSKTEDGWADGIEPESEYRPLEGRPRELEVKNTDGRQYDVRTYQEGGRWHVRVAGQLPAGYHWRRHSDDRKIASSVSSLDGIEQSPTLAYQAVRGVLRRIRNNYDAVYAEAVAQREKDQARETAVLALRKAGCELFGMEDRPRGYGNGSRPDLDFFPPQSWCYKASVCFGGEGFNLELHGVTLDELRELVAIMRAREEALTE